MRRPTTTALILATAALLAGACTGGEGSDDPTSPGPSISPAPAGSPAPTDDPTGSSTSDAQAAADAVTAAADFGVPVGSAGTGVAGLVAFDSCDALREHYVAGASDLVGPYGLGGQFGGVMMEGDMMASTEESAAAEGGADSAVAAAPVEGEDFSTTNVQEAGVDEPDVVKTDGEMIVTVTEGGLRVVDVASAEVVGRLELPEDAWNSELLLSGDDLLVLSSGGGGRPVPTDTGRIPAFAPERVTVTRVDLADPANPTVVGGLRLEGSYRSARMVDGTVRLVMVSQPSGLSFVQPTDNGLSAEQDAEDENRRILAESDLDDWVPHLQVLDSDGNAGDVRRVLDCTAVARPDEFSGFSTLSVLTMDIAAEQMDPTSSAGLVAAGDTVYASTDRLVVATSPWGGWIMPFVEMGGLQPEQDELTTDLHAFDISDPSTTRWVGSAEVEGTILNQFSLSETDGVIRVATTTQPTWWGGPEDTPSESSLVVFTEGDGELVETGRVDGLGKTERIYAVRYLGPDLAAIVTFRETDPLYLVDTSDPTAPEVTGELKIPGFSSYLHPVGEDRLVGIGQDADEQGRTQGLQASVFDVSDVSDPQRVSQVVVGEGYSPVESDHRAFLHWPATGQVVLPAELWEPDAWEDFEEECSDGGECIEPKPFIGAVVLGLDGADISEQGRVSLSEEDEQGWWGSVQRSIVIGDDLWLVAGDRLARVDLAGLDDRLVVPLR
ncbi:beta-propeller domain-containing protein [Salsipaludibacter albus]|uniref:beta-propeller domain-containing protein n=1 Tax=Salsipaludibacter albus TaxID=2849650 RepID=UPI001EE3EE01|nr:beta-propeller domain-containing protein [Salsipaludibacter albus]MBY5162563.1 beta-propeller domain-containing protein [Salsipaludibacter albus]